MQEGVTKSLWLLWCEPVEAGVFIPLYALDAQDARRQADACIAARELQDTTLVAFPEGYSWQVWGVPGEVSLPGTLGGNEVVLGCSLLQSGSPEEV
jgi:hypothetical protein